MKRIIWDESYNIGVPSIDTQHQEIIRMINKLISEKNATVDSETISETLSGMTKYAEYHFKTEEDFMLEINFPDFKNHKKQHIGYRKKTFSFCLDTMVHKDSIPADIHIFLKEWWINHILESDMKIKEFLQSKKNLEGQKI